MKKPTQKQILGVISVFMNNTEWDTVNSIILQEFIKFPTRAGQKFAEFLNSGGVELPYYYNDDSSNTISVDRTTQLNEVNIDGISYPVVYQNKKSLTITSVDPRKITLETRESCGKEVVVTAGDFKCTTPSLSGGADLDAKVCLTFFENQHMIPQSWKLHITNYGVCFNGTIFLNEDNEPCSLSLKWVDDEWYRFFEFYNCHGDNWAASGLSAVLAI